MLITDKVSLAFVIKARSLSIDWVEKAPALLANIKTMLKNARDKISSLFYLTTNDKEKKHKNCYTRLKKYIM